MKNNSLAADYLARSGNRLAALEVLAARKSWADVVREAQEVVELLLKAALRLSGIEVPRLHDVSRILEEERELFPKPLQPNIARLGAISRELRRDRELAFYGSEDLTPSDFYREEDGLKALESARWVYSVIMGAFKQDE